MKKFAMKVLDDTDREILHVLKSLGVQRKEATLITYLMNVDEATSREIELGSDLREPEVSIAAKTLRQNDWIDVREIQREGKGRPVKVYRLKASIDQIIKHVEEVKILESNKTMQSFQKLKEMIAS